MSIDRIFDRLIPATAGLSPRSRHRARLLHGVTALGSVFGTLFSVLYFAIGHYAGAAVIITGLGCMLLSSALIYWFGKVEIAAHWTVFTWVAGFTVLAMMEGGLNSHAVAWLIGGVPMLGWLLLQGRAALIWTGIAILALLGFCAVKFYGYELQPMYDESWRIWVGATGYVSLALFLAGFGAVFESSRQAADQKVLLTSEQLSDVNARFTESERFIRRIADCTPGLIYLLNVKKQRIEFANARLSEALGLDPQANPMIDLAILKDRIVGRDVRGLLSRLCHRLAEVPDGAVVETEYELDRSGQEWLWDCRDTVFSRDLFGKPETVLGLAEDVTERRLAEKAVRASEARFRDLFENSPEAIFVYNLDGYVIDLNKAACRLHVDQRQNLLGKHLSELVPGDSRAQVLRAFPQFAAGKLNSIEGFILTSDGRDVPVMVSSSQIHYQDHPALLIHARDVAEVRELAAQLLQSQKMEAIGRLAGGVAHDFNNLLTAIIGYNELVRRTLDPHTELHRFSDEVSRAAERAAQLTHQLLAFSRQQQLQPVLMDMNQSVRRTEMMLRRLVGENITLETRLTPNLHPILADPGQIEQVIVNLAVNARDAMPPDGGSIVIRTSALSVAQSLTGARSKLQPGEWVILSVEDTGTGMAPEVIAHIFEPFFTTKAEGKGTGLGLATSYGITKQSGGHLVVHSSPGEGSIFEVCLPASTGILDPVDEALRSGNLPAGHEKLLLVEDRAEIREMLHEVLLAQGYQVWVAHDGEDALRVLEQELEDGVDLLVTDVIMPRMLGSTLAQKFHDQYPETPVLFCSGTEINAQVAEAMEEGWGEFLPKPFTPSVLVERVRRLLDVGVNCDLA